MEKLVSFRILAFFILVVVYMANAAPVDQKATGMETFNITVMMYAGRPDPTWALNTSSTDRHVRTVIGRLRAMDTHHGGHAGHDAHAATGSQPAVTESFLRNGYRKIEVDHIFGNGNSHKMVIKRCSDPFFEWDILSKTSPSSFDGSLMGLYDILKACAIEQMKTKKAAENKTKKTTPHVHNDSHAH